MDAGYRFADAAGGHPFRGQGVGVPTLREVFERYPDIPIIVEMKADSEEMGRAVAAEVVPPARSIACARPATDRAVSPPPVTRCRRWPSSASRMEVRLALYRRGPGGAVRRAPYGGYQVPEHAGSLRVVSPRFVRHAHRAGLEVQLWTIDEAADMERLLAWGVDG